MWELIILWGSELRALIVLVASMAMMKEVQGEDDGMRS